MTNGHNMIITAPNAFELFCRAIVAWKDTTHFPTITPLQLYDLSFPAPEAKSEPERDGDTIPVFSRDIGDKARIWLALAEAPGHKAFGVMKFGENPAAAYRLTVGQCTVAMAILIDETVKEFEVTHADIIPLAVEVPLVHSPTDWNDRNAPVPVLYDVPPPPPPPAQPSLTITMQGIPLSDREPMNNESSPRRFAARFTSKWRAWGRS